MKKSTIFVFLLICSFFSSFLAANDSIALIHTTEGDPDGIIDGLVSVISGDFCETSTDFVIEGPDKLIFQRFYSSRNYVTGQHPGAWRAFNTNFLVVGKDPDREQKFIEFGREVDALAFVGERSGGIITYSGKICNGETVNEPLLVNAHKQGPGVTNTYANDISGQTNHLNNYMFCKETTCETILGDGSIRIYEKVESLPSAILGEELIPHLMKMVDSPTCYRLIEEILPSRNRILYSYDDSGHVSHIEMKNGSKSKILSWIDLSYSFFLDGCSITITTSDVKTLNYQFKHVDSTDANPLYLLMSVSGNHMIPCSYNYSDNDGNYCLDEKFYANRPYYKVDYEADGRVKTLYELHPTEIGYFPKYSFIYGKQYTKVIHPSGVNTIYRYNDNLVLSSVDTYDDKSVLVRQDVKFWGTKESETSLLIAKGIFDGNQKLKSYTSYRYDNQFNVVEETLYGNLSGKDEPNIQLDPDGKLLNSNKIECYHICKAFSSDGYNNIIRRGKVDQTHTILNYENDSNLLVKEFIVDGGIKKRTFYFYNEDGARIRSIQDDGVEQEESQLNGVTERHIQIIQTKENLPGVGLPIVIEDKFLEFSTGEESLLRRRVNTFDSQSHLLNCDIYDAKNNFVTNEVKEYNSLGLPIREMELGVEYIYTYDAVGNLLSIFTPHLNKTVANTYNSRNQLLQITNYLDGQELKESYSYDNLGRKIASINEQGNTTRYEYDSFGRESRLILPSFFNEFGEAVEPTIEFEYDIFDNVISERDPQGQITYKHYNIRGDVTKIIHPDQTHEWFRYEPSGILHRKLSRERILTVFEYDYQDRIAKEHHLECTDKGASTAIRNLVYLYNAFHCKECTNDRLREQYEYDHAGRLIAVVKMDISAESIENRKVEYVYDDQGRVAHRKTWYGFGSSDYSDESFQFDLQGRITEKCVKDGAGTQLLWKGFTYQLDDRASEEYGMEKGSKTLLTRTEYNGLGEVVQYSDALGNKTHIDIDRFFLNSYSQNVIKKTVTSPLGIRTEVEFDTLSRPVTVLKLDQEGVLLACQQYFYDISGNKYREIDQKIVRGQLVGKEETRWKYGLLNRLEEHIQHFGTDAEVRTVYSYNNLGQLEKKRLPGCKDCLNYKYTKAGHVESVKYSNELLPQEFQIANFYTYDSDGNAITASSNRGLTHVSREYNVFGQVVKEKVADGGVPSSACYETSYAYDRKGRLLTVTLPDKSTIEYCYNAVFGTEVKRVSKEGSTLYSHSYHAYDLDGRLLNETLQDKWDVNYCYNGCGQTTRITSPFYSEEADYDNAGRLYERKKNIKDKKLKSTYAYSDLSQLIEEGGRFKNNYVYDSLDNLINIDGVALNYKHQQLISHHNKSYSYDPHGNLLRKTQNKKEDNFKTNVLSQLLRVEKSDNTILTFVYDAFGRRLVKKSTNGPGLWAKVLTFQHFLYIGNQEVGTIDEKGKILELRIPGIQGENLSAQSVAFELQGNLYGVIHDTVGNVSALINPKTGNVVESYTYSAFGKEIIFDSKGACINKSAVLSPWKFAEKRYDEETGFLYFGCRYYDLEVNRWITPDPIGILDGPNLYAYVHNNPLNKSDPYGLTAQSDNTHEIQHYFHDDTEWIVYCWGTPPTRCCIGNGVKRKLKDGEGLPKIRYNYGFENGYPLHQQSREFDLGLPDHPDIGIGYINGINCNFNEAWDGACYLSRMANGINIHGVFNASRGVPLDLIECVMGLNYIATPPVYHLHQMWNKFFSRSSSNAMFLIICHSQGAIHVRNALIDYPPELRDRILVVAIAPGAYIYSNTCHQVTHYRAMMARDFIPFVDLGGLMRENKTTKVLQSDSRASLHDHSFKSNTYREALMLNIKGYLKSSGVKYEK